MFDEERCAYVQFEDYFGAYAAQQYLSGWYIPQHNVMLTVKWLPSKELDNSATQPAKQLDADSNNEQKRTGGISEMSIDKPCFQPSAAGVTSPPLMPQNNPSGYAPGNSLGTMFEVNSIYTAGQYQNSFVPGNQVSHPQSGNAPGYVTQQNAQG